jgi:phosphoribosylformylglycinamidine synthase
MSMRTQWKTQNESHEVVSPISLVVSAFAPVKDITKTWTPELAANTNTQLLLIDLARGHKRLGASVLAQVTKQLGDEVPDVDEPHVIVNFVKALDQLRHQALVLAYHDRSDGGLLLTLTEMAFAANMGLDIDLSTYCTNWRDEGLAALFNEELGAVIQVQDQHLEQVIAIFKQHGLEDLIHTIARVNETQSVTLTCYHELVADMPLVYLRSLWSKVSYHLAGLRDNPDCVSDAYEQIKHGQDQGLFVEPAQWQYTAQQDMAPFIAKNVKPRVAILREQGVNGHWEMAAAFTDAGFDAIDVTMSDLLADKNLSQFHGLVACGGFSYGDVLGAGRGWAKTIAHSDRLRDMFTEYFNRPDTFSLGVCNGCQMLSQLRDLIPGAEHWPTFVRNQSEQFEARLALVKVIDSPSILMNDLSGMTLPIVVAHGEGRVMFRDNGSKNAILKDKQLMLQYVNHQGETSERYPHNPNGSAQGMTGFTSTDGRATIMMPHPERVFRAWQLSWKPKEWQGDTPWMKMFTNARKWLK